MSVTFAVKDAVPIGNAAWEVSIPPHQVRFLGANAPSVGARSVIVVTGANYESASKSLSFSADQATALNVGTQDETIIVSGEMNVAKSKSLQDAGKGRTSYGPGDLQFLGFLERLLPIHMQEVGRALLDGVRARAPGDLKKGKKNNFSDTPDNFWYVIIQPQVRQLQLTVRGDPKHFDGVSKLQVLDDRGNSRFKVSTMSDVSEALKLIFHAKRKKS